MIEILIIFLLLVIIALRLWNLKNRNKSGLYYVYNPQGQGPRYIHQSFESALNEAKRLHDKQPQFSFEILKIMQIIESDSGYELISEDEIPF